MGRGSVEPNKDLPTDRPLVTSKSQSDRFSDYFINTSRKPLSGICLVHFGGSECDFAL